MSKKRKKQKSLYLSLTKAFLNYVKDGNDDGTNTFVHEIHKKVIPLYTHENFVSQGMTVGKNG